jgi:hypothetical protein
LTLDCESLSGSFPWPPANATAMSAFHSSDTDLRWDDPSDLGTGPSDVAAYNNEVTTASTELVVNGTPTIETAASGYLIVVSAPIALGETIEVDGVVVTCVHGVAGSDEFDGSSADSFVVAESIKDAINDGSVGGWQIVSATRTDGSVGLEADTAGESGNDITLSSSTADIVASGSTLNGGAVDSELYIAQYTLSAVDGTRTSGSLDFDLNDAGSSLAEAINDPDNGLTGVVSATWGGNCLLIEAAAEGLAGNGIEVSSNSETLFVTRTATSGGSGTPCPPGKDNSRWGILGVNIYRSDSGERGPYFRVNQVPVGTQFYRDRTDVAEIPAEIIAWDGGWVFKGDSPNNKGWRLKTRYSPMVKRPESDIGMLSNAVHADSPADVEVYIDGERAVVEAVFGAKGEVDISTEAVWNPATESFELPPIPEEDSVVEIRYYYRRLGKLENTLDRRFKVFYRVSSVALDPTGESPTGLVETPLGYCAPISPMNSEPIDYMWAEAIRRNRWILEQGGERVKLFIRRINGVRCQCMWDPRLEEISKQPVNNCLQCYGTGWIGGYEGPYDIIIGPDESERRVSQTPNGRRLENTYEVWIGPSPMTSQRDFIVKQNGERFSIGPVTRTQVRGVVLQQSFQIGYLDTGDIRYRVPMGQLERLPWPETRYTNPEDSTCVESDPYPVGADYQATPMATEKEDIPDGREKRGRTPVYQNLTYGGKGGR